MDTLKQYWTSTCYSNILSHCCMLNQSFTTSIQHVSGEQSSRRARLPVPLGLRVPHRRRLDEPPQRPGSQRHRRH